MKIVEVSLFAELSQVIGFFRAQIMWAEQALGVESRLLVRLEDFDLLETRCITLSEIGAGLGLSLSSRSCASILRVLHQIRQEALRDGNLAELHPRAEQHIHFPRYYFQAMATGLSELYNRLKDELAGSTYIQIRAESAAALAEIAPFGTTVEAQFPGLVYDINEGTKCIALGRYTASAFHFLRCFEGGIYALTRCLGISDPVRAQERSWGALLQKVREEMQRRWPVAQGRTTGDAALFEQIVVTLATIQNPWRNATMHLDNRYDRTEADEIMTAARRFLQIISSRMDEQGNPTI